jgi:hypothetical protein
MLRPTSERECSELPDDDEPSCEMEMMMMMTVMKRTSVVVWYGRDEGE